ncbi:hypothetical protein ACFYXS_14055 [Streptomyces sp. NPDC002574]|uniref:hypothetical protein n=1 Tax=Streptomyces sp. NPDC002574 TaxID=3364652 RepID=UPI0036B95ABF
MDLVRHLAAVEALRARLDAAGGDPGFHLADLAAGDGCRDPDEPLLPEGEDDVGAACESLVAALTARYGTPAVLVDLRTHLERSALGEPVAAPLAVLSGHADEAFTWRVDRHWIAIADARPHLLAAVADTDLIP